MESGCPKCTLDCGSSADDFMSEKRNLSVSGCDSCHLCTNVLEEKADTESYREKSGYVILPFLLIFAVEGIITQVYHVEKDSPKEMFSLPFQQTARYVKEYGDEIPGEEREVIAKVLDYDSLAEIYEPMTADPVKTTYRSGSTGESCGIFQSVDERVF